MSIASIEPTDWLYLICTILSLIGCLYALVASWLVQRFAADRQPPAATAVAISILKPLHGAEINLHENLASFCRQNYDAASEIIFGVQDAADPAIGVVNQLKAEFPNLALKLVVDTATHGSNRKVANLINLHQSAQHDLIVLADSDISVDADYLQRICNAMAVPGTGLVTCLYQGRDTGTLWSRLAAMSVALHFLPSVIVGLASGLARPCFGSTIALRRDTLTRIGGFEAFADQLADDYAMGAAVRKLGLRVDIPNFLVGHTFPDQGFGEMLRHELRWARTIFSVDRLGFAGSGITHALPFALIAAASRGFDGAGLVVVTFALACRLTLQMTVTRAFAIGKMSLWLLPCRDLISFVVYLACFVSSRVEWRGRDFTLGANGTMVPAASRNRKTAQNGTTE